jgi:hypothetical protein
MDRSNHGKQVTRRTRFRRSKRSKGKIIMASEEGTNRSEEMIELPAPTAWPMVAAFGIALLAAGLVTHPVVSATGLILLLRGAVGWFKEDLPVEHVEPVRVRPAIERAQVVKVSARAADHLIAGRESHRVRVPAQIHPYSSGLKGGLFGGVAMAIIASAYGLISHGSIWYPINLLAAAALPSMAQADAAQLNSFNATAFIVALIMHGAGSMLVGLLFAVLLPMLPARRAAFWGSFLAPLLWTALVWATLRLINPLLDARIDWFWFIASQVAFGMTTGYIIHHTGTVETMQTWPLAARAGIEAPGLLDEKEDQQ